MWKQSSHRRIAFAMVIISLAVSWATGLVSAKSCQEYCDAEHDACMAACTESCGGYNNECLSPCNSACYSQYYSCSSGAMYCNENWYGWCVVDVWWHDGAIWYSQIASCNIYPSNGKSGFETSAGR